MLTTNLKSSNLLYILVIVCVGLFQSLPGSTLAIGDRATVIERREANYWFAIAIISCFMTIPLSKPIWDVVAVIQRLQYPWRFHTLVTLAITAVFTLAISQLQKPAELTSKKILIGFTTLIILALLLAIAQSLPLVQYRFGINNYFSTQLILFTVSLVVLIFAKLKPVFKLQLNKNSAIALILVTSLILSNSILIATRLNKERDISKWLSSVPESRLSQDANEYRTQWVSEKIFQPESLEELSKNSAKVVVTKGAGDAIVQRWKPREITLQVSAQADILLTINQFYYPGWKARINHNTQPLFVQPSQPEGLLQVRVPSGKHSIQVVLDAGIEEQTGKIISTGFGVLTLFLLFWWRKSSEDIHQT